VTSLKERRKKNTLEDAVRFQEPVMVGLGAYPGVKKKKEEGGSSDAHLGRGGERKGED